MRFGRARAGDRRLSASRDPHHRSARGRRQRRHRRAHARRPSFEKPWPARPRREPPRSVEPRRDAVRREIGAGRLYGARGGEHLRHGALIVASPGYDPLKDFTGITLTCLVPQVLVVNPALPAQSVKELVALAKSHPGKISYASSGNGSTGHMAAELFN